MNRNIVLAGVLVAALVAGVALYVASTSGGGVTADESELDLASQPRLGAADAPVQLVFFEDFLCPHCGTFTETVVPRIEREFVTTGTASIHFVNFVVIGPEAERIAHVGECVAAQGSDGFWAFEKAAFRSQAGLTERRAIELAKEYVNGIDAPSLDRCVEGDERLDDVRADVATAQRLGLTGTPSVLVDGTQVDPTYESIARAIGAALDARP